MRKIILSLFLVICFTLSFAQKANVSKAKNKALMENPDFSGARQAIKLALNDSTTKNLAETWYVAGLIGNKENEALYQKALLKMPFDTIVKGTALMESYNYFLQALKLDQVPDAKGKVKARYSRDIKPLLKDYYTIQQNLIANGAYQFEKKNYEGAVKTFEAYLEIPKLPIMNNELKMDSTYDMITFYTAMAASNANMHEKAIGYYQALKDKKYQLSNVYQDLADEYLKQKDSVNYLKTLKEGIEKVPTQSWFLQNLINYYIHLNKIPDALGYLNTAIEREPNFAQYQFVKGQLYLSIDDFENAEIALKKAIELNPKMAEAYAEMGRTHYNNAVKMSLSADKIKDNSLYKAEEKKIDLKFREAIPFYLKAIELNPKEVEYKLPLKQLYYRLQMNAEFDAIKKDIEATK